MQVYHLNARGVEIHPATLFTYDGALCLSRLLFFAVKFVFNICETPNYFKLNCKKCLSFCSVEALIGNDTGDWKEFNAVMNCSYSIHEIADGVIVLSKLIFRICYSRYYILKIIFRKISCIISELAFVWIYHNCWHY